MIARAQKAGRQSSGIGPDDQLDLLVALGARLRERREEMRLSRRQVAERAVVSERFLASVESGDGNISVARLFSVAFALNFSMEELFHELVPDSHLTKKVALLGIRGAGKSTLGRALAQSLRVRFVELDELIAKKAGMSLSTIFEMHGEAYFRKVEREALREILEAKEPVVIATSGSLVTDIESYRLLRENAITIWLKARPKDHWDRVVAEGDGRPMSGRRDAMQELQALFDSRKTLYQQASHVVDTTTQSIPELVQSLTEAAATGFRTKHLGAKKKGTA